MSKSFQPFVSIIIPVYNDLENLKICLNALEGQTYPRQLYEIIVIDNGSDDSIDYLKEEFNHVIITVETKRGSYAARNQGIQIAKGEVIAFTDADCIPAHDWIENGVAELQTTKNCGLIAGNVELLFKDPQRLTAVELYESISAFPQRENVEVKHFGATANVFTYKRVIDEVGHFNEDLKSGGDYEWGQRVFYHGYHLVYANDARVQHPARSSLRELYRRQTRIMGGIQDLGYKARDFSTHLIDFLPPVVTSFRVLKDKRLTSFYQKIKVISVMILVRYMRAYEKIRLCLGRDPKR